MSHALVIGGSGMLRGAVLDLCNQFHTVSVVARNAKNLHQLQLEDSRINAIQADYTDSSRFIACIDESTAQYGSISLVVSWIHETAPNAPILLARSLNEYRHNVEYYHVLGSAYAQPTVGASKLRAAFETLECITYHQIILGFIVERQSSRWLSNEEISSGVMLAIKLQLQQNIVGTVEPWNMRP